MTSRTKGQSDKSRMVVGSKGVPHGESARATPTTGHRQIPRRRPHRGHLPGIGLLEKLALQMAGSLPGNGSLLERRTEQTPQNHPDQNAPTHRPGCRGPAPDAGPAWQRLWSRFHPAGARTARERAGAFPANDLSDSPPLCKGDDINRPPSSIRPSARKCSPSIDMASSSREYGNVRRCVIDRTVLPALDAGSGAEQGKQLGHLQREHVACPFLGCEVHLVKVSTLGGIMSGRWTTSFSSLKRSWPHLASPGITAMAGGRTSGTLTRSTMR